MSSLVTVFSLCYFLRFFQLCLRHLHFLKFSILLCRQYKLDLDVWEEVQLQEQGLWCCSAAADQHQRMVCRILIFHQGEIFHGCCDCFRNRDLMFQVLGRRKQANPTDQYPKQTHILEQVTSLRRTLNLDSKNYISHRRSFPTGLARLARDSRTTTKVWRPASSRTWRTRVDSRSTAFRSSTMRLVLQSSTTSGQMFIQHHHTSWIASSTSNKLHMAWTPSTRYRDGIQWHDEPCFFRSKIICEDSELQMTRWTTITKAKDWSPRIWRSMCFLVDQLSCKWFFCRIEKESGVDVTIPITTDNS